MRSIFLCAAQLLVATAWLSAEPPAAENAATEKGSADTSENRATRTANELLDSTPDKNALAGLALVHETYVNNNWEIFLTAADRSEQTNLTNTPDRHELYPQVSPDHEKICFVCDTGSGRQTIRSVWVMDIDGTNRQKIADFARQPCWCPDSRTVVYLPQEYKKFNVVDYFTKGLVFYNIETAQSRSHPNEALRHLYNPTFAPNGKWLAATVHAGMGYGHANLLIGAQTDEVIDLGLKGCRPCLNSDGRHIGWGEDDHTVVIAEVDLSANEPAVGKRLLEIHDAKNKVYHIDWSPDGRFVSVSRGPDGKGDITMPGTYEAACEMVGVHADGWDIVAIPVQGQTKVDLSEGVGRFWKVTDDGNSNKESSWVQRSVETTQKQIDTSE